MEILFKTMLVSVLDLEIFKQVECYEELVSDNNVIENAQCSIILDKLNNLDNVKRAIDIVESSGANYFHLRDYNSLADPYSYGLHFAEKQCVLTLLNEFKNEYEIVLDNVEPF